MASSCRYSLSLLPSVLPCLTVFHRRTLFTRRAFLLSSGSWVMPRQLSSETKNESPTSSLAQGSPSTSTAPPQHYMKTQAKLGDMGPVVADDRVGSSRKFISVVRAMSDYMLSPRHLDSLTKYERRSPFESEPPIVVFRRKDVEKKALEIYGSMKNVQEERMRRIAGYQRRKSFLQGLRIWIENWKKGRKRRFGGVGGQGNEKFNVGSTVFRTKQLQTSARVIYTAIFVNGANTILKFGAWIISGSHSIFAEFLHSVADTVNQVVLLIGMKASLQDPDSKHPYGYTNARYVASLISGVGFLCIGSGVSIYHGISGLMHPTHLEHLGLAICVLGGSFISEFSSLIVASNAMRKNAKIEGMSYWQYLMYGDPAISFVFLEDLAAVIGVTIAGSCMGLSVLLNSPTPDASGSIVIGVLLAAVAGHIVLQNSAALVGTSIPHNELIKLNQVLENDALIRGVHDVKGIDMGNSLIRYKAEIDIDGLELTRRYLQLVDLDVLLKEMQGMKSPMEVEAFLLKHGEQIVDRLGAEIDRIEAQLKDAVPDVRHVDLEVL